MGDDARAKHVIGQEQVLHRTIINTTSPLERSVSLVLPVARLTKRLSFKLSPILLARSIVSGYSVEFRARCRVHAFVVETPLSPPLVPFDPTTAFTILLPWALGRVALLIIGVALPLVAEKGTSFAIAARKTGVSLSQECAPLARHERNILAFICVRAET